jgi:hypothetical protein
MNVLLLLDIVYIVILIVDCYNVFVFKQQFFNVDRYSYIYIIVQ